MAIAIACIVLYGLLMLTTFILLGISLFDSLEDYNEGPKDMVDTVKASFNPEIHKLPVDIPIYAVSAFLALITFIIYGVNYSYNGNKNLGLVGAFFLGLMACVGQLSLVLIHKGQIGLLNISFILTIVNIILGLMTSAIVWINNK